MSEAVIVMIIVAALANFTILVKLIFMAGGANRSLEELVKAKIPEQLVEIKGRLGVVEGVISDNFTPTPVLVPARRNHSKQ